VPDEPAADWQCLRCELILARQPADEIPEHARRCEFRDTGRDPDPVPPEEKSGGR
jgi:hypothetical protein